MWIKHARNRYLLASALVLGFALLYECFSHQVYSLWLLGAFLVPLLLGALPCAFLPRAPRRFRPGVLTRCFWGSGLASLTVGCLFRGVLEIYGSTNRLGAVYGWSGALLCAAALAVWSFGLATGTPKRSRS